MNVYSNVNWKQYFNYTNPIINSYLQKYGNGFIEQTFNRICLAHKTKKSKIILIRFRDSDIVSILESKDYIKALEILLSFCIKIEYYEICTDIQKQIRKMKGKSRKNTQKQIVNL